MSEPLTIVRVMPKQQHEHSMEDFKCDLMCPECETFFVESKKLKKHIESLHDRVKKRYKCDYCTSSYNQKCGLIKHVKITHPNESLSFDKLCQSYESSENKQAQKVGIEGIGRKKKCQLVKKNGNLSISEKEDSNSNGQKLGNSVEIRKDLKYHPDGKCDLKITNTFLKPKENLVSHNLNLKMWKIDGNQLLNEMVASPMSKPFREPVSRIDFPKYYRLFLMRSTH